VITNEQRKLNYAQQNGHSPLASDPEVFERLSVKDLRALAESEGLPFNTKTRKPEFVQMLSENGGVVDDSKLTPKQRKRLRLKAHR
jgi:hypothetical protein